MNKHRWIQAFFLTGALVAVAACNDDSEPAGKGEASFEITDAPADDANVRGVFVTVADLKVNGQSLQGFSKQTIDLKAYSEGRTEILGTGQFDARTYENLVLVLDLETDENGGSPGTYVLDQDGVKHQLKSTTTGTTEIVVRRPWTVAKDTKSDIVVDFDLRKSIRHTDNGYALVSDTNLEAAVSLVTKAQSGTIRGTYEESSSSGSDKIIVYAYKKGTFNAATETTPQGDDAILFAKARSSAEVKQGLTGKEFTLAFLEEGEYELHFVGYTRDTATGRYSFRTRLQSQTTVDGSAANLVSVKGGVTVNVIADITGLL